MTRGNTSNSLPGNPADLDSEDPIQLQLASGPRCGALPPPSSRALRRRWGCSGGTGGTDGESHIDD
eukprot:CAMPEP_0179162972 /NCGR_PEP_ID=MMETSP0796-20121207/79864_1 /TAXON_ID=73915 /ORGANISM="Pyrodinium bahamense, Strain pbaha01" /LENGTH=65 /DNA_ID=CAMNT_0020865217 /DNA_START=160 /DNA_END=354 /DNA_ORIENTATION=+